MNRASVRHRPQALTSRCFQLSCLIVASAIVADQHRIVMRAALAAEDPQDSRRHVIPAGTPTDGALLRSVCEDEFPIGDTISAELHPARVATSRPQWWPKQFIVVLRLQARRRASASRFLPLTISAARVDGLVVDNVRGSFVFNPESSFPKAGRPEIRCYARTAEINGQLTATLRVHRSRR